MMRKPTLVIGCSNKKKEGASNAWELYDGVIFQQLNSRLSNPLQRFDILILSAEHGLIEAASSKITQMYDKRMPSKKEVAAINNYAEKHGRAARRLLRKLAKNSSGLFVVLSNDYLSALEAMLGKTIKAKKDLLGEFPTHYISRGHKGIGELRGRLGRVIDAYGHGEQDSSTEDAIWYRSGVANMSEIGYIAAGCDVGTTLARVNSEKNSDLFSVLLDSTKANRIFIDNGLITLHKQGKKIDTQTVFKQYFEICNALPLGQSKNIATVIPDAPESPLDAIEIVKRHKADILKLAKRTDCIIPIHRAPCIATHAMAMMKELGYPDLRLGIPCLESDDANFALSTSEIDTLLSLKHPKGGKLFRRIHYFAMSEKTSKHKLQPRIALAHLHGYTKENLSLDCCRTTAIFGYNKNGPRIGTAVEKEQADLHLEKQVLSHKEYKAHDFYQEFYEDNGEPFVTQDFYQLINPDNIREFWVIYNIVMKDHPDLQYNADYDDSEIEQTIEVAWNLTSQRYVDNLVFERLKYINWRQFMSHLDGIEELSGSEARYRAIEKIFHVEKRARGVQLPLRLVA